jgi:glycogen synthase
LAAYSQGEKQKRLMVRGMKADFSWQRAAQQYMELYRKATGKRGEDDMK